MQTPITADLDSRLSPVGMLKAQGRIILAVMLHDIFGRFGGNPFGFLMMGVGWPLSHILILLAINAGLGRTAPYGDSTALWFATGIVPFMAFQYMSRNIALGIILERPLLTFPIVKATDILLARAFIEILNTGLVALIVFAIFWIFGINFVPTDAVQASCAMLSMMLLGLGFGIINGVIAGMAAFWITAYALSAILFWISSGIVFVPEALPEVVRNVLSYLPWLQGVEWMRSAYYPGYGGDFVDPPYLISFGLCSVFLGLALERLMRGKLLK